MHVTKARALIIKHHKYAWVFTFVALLLVGGVFLKKELSQAATYTFTQASWAGGATTATSTHTLNQTGWTQYATSTNLLVGSTVSINPYSFSFTDDGATSTIPNNPLAAGGGFGNGANSSTQVTGSGTGASITLGPPSSCTTATGGTITIAGSYCVHSFTSSGTFTPSTAITVDYLVVAGGGGGAGGAAWSAGGGGGAGGLLQGAGFGVVAQSYPVTVGAGGAGAANNTYANGTSGGNSTFSTITAVGGGYGTYGGSGATGGSGGSGGGTGATSAGRNGGAGTAGQGFAGGGNLPSGTGGNIYNGGGGGGGAGGVGGQIPLSGVNGANGGAGVSSSITGATVFYAGGGGGGANTGGIGGIGGVGGGGAGGDGAVTNTGVNGVANTGGGGGGGNGNGGGGGSGIVIIRYLAYAPSGTFTSAVIDFGLPTTLTTFSASTTLPVGTSVTFDVRAGDSPTPPTWGTTNANWASVGLSGLASGSDISTLGVHRYLQYRVNLATTNSTVTPSVDSVTINNAGQYNLTGSLISSVYDTTADTNLMSNISWAVTGTSGTETIKFQIRSSPDGATWSNWCGLADTGTTCTGTNYFTTSGSALPAVGTHPLNTGNNDRYFQYKAILASGGGVTPILSGVTVQYVVNAPPDVQNARAVQNTDGTVTVSFDMRDTDTNTGATPYKVASTLQYCTTGSCTVSNDVGWVNATAVTGAVGATTTIGINFASSTITWTPSTDYANQYNLTQKMRVKLDDGEAANRYGYGMATFVLDTTPPTVSTFSVDSSTGGTTAGTIRLNATDATSTQYRICNDSAFPATDAQGNSCAWSTLSATASTTNASWVLTGYPNNEVVYMQIRDAYTNTTTRTAVAPAMPGSFDFKDISNLTAVPPTYREFLSWSPFTATTSSTFASYNVYTSLDGTNFSLLSTITNSTLNYYIDTITTATTSLHYYKVTASNTNGDVSNYTATVSDIPNGSGGAVAVAPTVSAITVPAGNIKNSSAQITFTTDVLSRATVYYAPYSGVAPTVCPTAYSTTNNSYLTSQSVFLNGLTANTNYTFCVQATEITGLSSALSSVALSGGTFRTAGGPIITNVTVNNLSDVSANVFWNTSTSSDGYVTYATNQAMGGAITVGSSTPITTAYSAGVYQHQIGLSGLTAGTTYYFKVSSTDPAANVSIADNNGQYYSFVTTYDRTPPTISGITTPVLASDSAVIVWQTDEPATTLVTYGTASTTLNKSTVLDATKSIYHVATLSSATTNGLGAGTNTLVASTKYYYTVTSADPAGNSATSPVQTFTTADSGSATIVAVAAYAPVAAGTQPDKTPPAISGVAVSDITPFGATVKFTTSKEADGSIEYGKTSSYTARVGDVTAWGTTHTVKVTGLALGTEYHFHVKAIDKAGNTGTSDDQTFKTTFLAENLKDLSKVENIEAFQKEIENTIESILPSLVPPFISKPQAVDVSDTGATITFKTNIKAFPIVGYVEDGAYNADKENPYTGEVSDVTTKGTDHAIKLTGLKSNTKYHYQARAFSLPKVIGKSADLTFTTKASKIAGSIVERKKDSFTVVWTTPEPASSIVEYKDMKRGITERKTDDAKKTTHSVKIENLPSGTTFEVNISGVNEAGNILEAGSPLSVTTSTDVTPPVISGFKVDNALVPGRTDRIQTIVTWITDEPSTSLVFFEEGAGTAGDTKELANKSELIDSYVLSHSVIVPSLKPGTIYRIKVVSSDDSGNVGTFGPRTIITPKQTESITDVIFKNFEDSFKFLRKI